MTSSTLPKNLLLKLLPLSLLPFPAYLFGSIHHCLKHFPCLLSLFSSYQNICFHTRPSLCPLVLSSEISYYFALLFSKGLFSASG